MKLFISLFLLCYFGINGVAQTPAHFFIGEKDLSGIHVYDMGQDQNLNYWISTNNGLYKYDGYTFIKLDCADMISNSLFNLNFDSKNNLYCNNLSGQIFKIKNDTCTLYYQIPDSLVTSEISIHIDKEDRFIILTNQILELKPDKTIQKLSAIRKVIYRAIKKKDGSLIVCTTLLEGVYLNEISDNIIRNLLIKRENKNPFYYPLFFQNKNLFYDRDNATLSIQKKDSIIEICNLDPTLKNATLHGTDNAIWVLKPSTGTYRLTDIYNPSNGGRTFFNSFKISNFFQDNEGNILLGTFNHGIIVIPPSSITNINLGKYKGDITEICATQANKIVIGTSRGEYAFLDNLAEMRSIEKNNSFPVELLEELEYDSTFLVGNRTGLKINMRTNTSKELSFSTLKYLKKLPHKQYLISTNTGLYIFSTTDSIFNPVTNEKTICDEFSRISIYSGRIYAADYDSISNTIFMGSSVGLKLYTENGVEEVKFNNKNIICRDFLYLKGRMYVLLNDNGLLVFENNAIIEHWTSKKELISNNTHLINTDGENIILGLDEGIQILTSDGENKTFINKSDGLTENRLIDIELTNNYLWVLHKNGIQKIDLKSLSQNRFIPNINLKSIKVNGEIISSETINKSFSHTQNKFEFNFESKSLRHQNEIKYVYRLLGVDSEWEESTYKNHIIDYKTLPPGDYKFQVKAICRNYNSAIVSYPFVISSPFWEKWWFFAGIALFVVLIVFVYVRRLLHKQKKKAQLNKELYESKLTAIQAQMNPHFLFNSLNSIQDLVLKNDAENAYTYISKFAFLVRSTLNQSDKDFIDFNEEILTIETYLSLEKLRFRESFDYEIILANEYDIVIPPMIIQPFIENSIVHGLLHKEGKKELTIRFEFSEKLICTIRDNGIGRKEAKMIQKRQYANHESFAMQAIRKRLEILGSHYSRKFEIMYTDLEENGKPTGTEVRLELPYQNKF